MIKEIVGFLNKSEKIRPYLPTPFFLDIVDSVELPARLLQLKILSFEETVSGTDLVSQLREVVDSSADFLFISWLTLDILDSSSEVVGTAVLSVDAETYLDFRTEQNWIF